MRTISNKNGTAGRGKSVRMTPQRAELLRLLEGNKSHPSAEELYRRVARKFPGVSFATVYNNLQALLAAGALQRVGIDPARARFDPCTARHAHLMCVKCGRIADLKVPARAPAFSGRPAGFTVLRYNLEFFGVCPACGKTAGGKEKRSCQKKERRSSRRGKKSRSSSSRPSSRPR